MNQSNETVMVQKIRSRYTAKETTKLDELRALDKKVKRPAAIFAYIFGSIAAIVMGAGMSLVMTDVGSLVGMTDSMIPGIAIGVIGMGLVLLNSPIYKGILGSRRNKYAGSILDLSDQIIRNG